MSLWLEAALSALNSGEYQQLREELLPCCPIKLPSCMTKEVEFAERRCKRHKVNWLYPVRFYWLLDGHEQSNFGVASASTCYHPEILLKLWQDITIDPQYRKECEAKGFRFDLREKAVNLIKGWIYIGDTFVEDFLEVESLVGIEIKFTQPNSSVPQPVFQEIKSQRLAAKASATQ